MADSTFQWRSQRLWHASFAVQNKQLNHCRQLRLFRPAQDATQKIDSVFHTLLNIQSLLSVSDIPVQFLALTNRTKNSMYWERIAAKNPTHVATHHPTALDYPRSEN